LLLVIILLAPTPNTVTNRDNSGLQQISTPYEEGSAEVLGVHVIPSLLVTTLLVPELHIPTNRDKEGLQHTASQTAVTFEEVVILYFKRGVSFMFITLLVPFPDTATNFLNPGL
jgi:hypothetical protein